MLANKASEVSDLQVKWLESKQQEQKIPDSLPKPLLKRSFSWAAEHKGPDAKVSKRSIRDEENDIALGGMRNPWTAVKRLSKVAEVGRDIARCWRHFVRRWPEALSTAGDYGSNDVLSDTGVRRSLEKGAYAAPSGTACEDRAQGEDRVQ